MSFTRYNRNRVIFDLVGQAPTDYTESVLLCIPKASWMIARTFLKGYGLRKTNYAADYQQGGYDTPSDAQFDLIDEAISSFLGATDMCTELTAGLAGIQAAIEGLTMAQATCCSGGSGGAGNVTGPPGPFVDDGHSNFPDGFSNRTEYVTAKCAAANTIVGGWLIDALWVQAADLTSFVASIMAVAIFTPIPFDDILALIALLVLWTIQGILHATMQELIDFIAANAEEIVCILFASSEAQVCQTQIRGLFNGSVGLIADQFVQYVTTLDVFAPLFELNIPVQNSQITAGVDCQVCSGLPCGVGVMSGEYNNQGFDANGYITIVVDADQASVVGCGLRYREYMQLNPPSCIEHISNTMDADGCIPQVWRSSPNLGETQNWDWAGAPPPPGECVLVGTISLHTLPVGQIILKCCDPCP